MYLCITHQTPNTEYNTRSKQIVPLLRRFRNSNFPFVEETVCLEE